MPPLPEPGVNEKYIKPGYINVAGYTIEIASITGVLNITPEPHHGGIRYEFDVDYGDTHKTVYRTTKEKAESERSRILKAIQKPKGNKMLESFKDYLKTHKDAIFTLTVVALIDHVFLNGALRERIQSALEGILRRTEKSLGAAAGAASATGAADEK